MEVHRDIGLKTQKTCKVLVDLVALSIFIKRKYFYCFEFELFMVQLCLFTLRQRRPGKRLSRDVFDTLATHSGFLHDVTERCGLMGTKWQQPVLCLPSLISLMVSVDVKHHVYLLCCVFIVQELCESRGGRPGLSVLTSLLVSVDVKLY